MKLKQRKFSFSALVILTTLASAAIAKADGETRADEQSQNDANSRFSYKEESAEANRRRESQDGTNTSSNAMSERQIAARRRLLQPREAEEPDHLMGCQVITDAKGVSIYSCPDDDEETDPN